MAEHSLPAINKVRTVKTKFSQLIKFGGNNWTGLKTIRIFDLHMHEFNVFVLIYRRAFLVTGKIVQKQNHSLVSTLLQRFIYNKCILSETHLHTFF